MFAALFNLHYINAYIGFDWGTGQSEGHAAHVKADSESGGIPCDVFQLVAATAN